MLGLRIACVVAIIIVLGLTAFVSVGIWSCDNSEVGGENSPGKALAIRLLLQTLMLCFGIWGILMIIPAFRG